MKFKNSEIEKWKTTYEKSIWKTPFAFTGLKIDILFKNRF